MIDLTRDIHSLTDFKRNTPEHLARLKETGRPAVLTVNGKAELIVQDAESYQKLMALHERLETIKAVRRGLRSAARGKGRDAARVFDELERELLDESLR